MDFAKIQRLVKPAVIALCIADGAGYFVARNYLAEPALSPDETAYPGADEASPVQSSLPIASFALPQQTPDGAKSQSQIPDTLLATAEPLGKEAGLDSLESAMSPPARPTGDWVAPQSEGSSPPELERRPSRSTKRAFARAFPAMSAGATHAALTVADDLAQESGYAENETVPVSDQAEVPDAPQVASEELAASQLDPVESAELPPLSAMPVEPAESEARQQLEPAQPAPAAIDATAALSSAPDRDIALSVTVKPVAPAKPAALSSEILPAQDAPIANQLRQTVSVKAVPEPQVSPPMSANLPRQTPRSAQRIRSDGNAANPLSAAEDRHVGPAKTAGRHWHDGLAQSSIGAHPSETRMDASNDRTSATILPPNIVLGGTKTVAESAFSINSHPAAAVRLSDLLDALEPLMDKMEFARLRASRNADASLDFETLRRAGIAARYDGARNELVLG